MKWQTKEANIFELHSSILPHKKRKEKGDVNNFQSLYIAQKRQIIFEVALQIIVRRLNIEVGSMLSFIQNQLLCNLLRVKQTKKY